MRLPDVHIGRTVLFLLISCRKMRPLPIDFPRKSWYNSKNTTGGFPPARTR